MASSARSYVAWILAQVPTLLVLSLLAGLAWWGVANDWKIPKFAQLWSDADETEEKKDDAKIKVVTLESTSSPGLKIQRIEFCSEEAVEKVGLKLEAVQKRKLGKYVVATGMIDYMPSGYARLTSRAAGVIRSVECEIGNKVKMGDVLALVDSAEVGRAKANLLQSLEQKQHRQVNYDRIKSASSDGALSLKLQVEAEYALREARTRLFIDHQALLNLGLPLHLAEIEKLSEDQLVRHLRLFGLPQSMRSKLDPETLTANLIAITAPFDGIVVQRNVAPGEFVDTNQAKVLFAVGNLAHLHLDLDVQPEHMSEIRSGQQVLFHPDGTTIEVVGKLVQISPEVDEKTRRVRVHCLIDNPKNDLRPNTFGTGRILLREAPEALTVPSDSVQTLGKDEIVFFACSETTFEARIVHSTGLKDGDQVEVEGLRLGDQVVTVGSFQLKSQLLRERIAGGE